LQAGQEKLDDKNLLAETSHFPLGKLSSYEIKVNGKNENGNRAKAVVKDLGAALTHGRTLTKVKSSEQVRIYIFLNNRKDVNLN